MNKPVPRSKYSKRFDENFDRIFRPADPRVSSEKVLEEKLLCPHGNEVGTPGFCGECYTLEIPFGEPPK